MIWDKMSAVLRIPMPIDIPISITSFIVEGLMIVSVGSNTDLSKLTWSINEVKPLRITVLQGGMLLVMSFRLYHVFKYNLFMGSEQVEFIGSNLFDYLATSESEFGKMIQPNQPSFAPALSLVALLTAVAAGFMVAKSASGDTSDNLGAPHEYAIDNGCE